jgi:hypothetical protein
LTIRHQFLGLFKDYKRLRCNKTVVYYINFRIHACYEQYVCRYIFIHWSHCIKTNQITYFEKRFLTFLGNNTQNFHWVDIFRYSASETRPNFEDAFKVHKRFCSKDDFCPNKSAQQFCSKDDFCSKKSAQQFCSKDDLYCSLMYICR